MDSRYNELKHDGKTYTEQWKIDEILIKNKFNWLVNAEIKNARLEIFQDTLVWNGGIWYNGDWYFGVWRDGEWRYGNWQNGVWYNGKWKDGTFKSGIIYNGTFFKGKIEGGEIRGGQFIDVEIDPKVIEYAGDEFKAKEQEQKQKTITATAAPIATPKTDVVKAHSTPPASQQPVEQPKIQQEKNNNYKMNKIKDFGTFVKESTGDLEDTFVDINIDQSKVDIKQTPGKIIIETPSKTDAYNAKMRLGGEIIADDEKQIQIIKDKK